MNKQDLVKEYDDYYTDNPRKWAVDARNQFAFEQIAKSSQGQEPKTILDVGCGNGHTLKYFGQKYPQASLFGIDISPVASRLAEANSGATVATCFIEDYKPEFGFDLVLCMGVAEHFADPLEGLKKIRALMPNGILYLEIPDNTTYSPGGEGYRRLSVGSRQLEWHWTRDTWESVILKSGFGILDRVEGLKPAWRLVWLLS